MKYNDEFATEREAIGYFYNGETYGMTEKRFAEINKKMYALNNDEFVETLEAFEKEDKNAEELAIKYGFASLKEALIWMELDN